MISRRLFLPVLLEATRILQESLVESPSAIEAALRRGLGMARSDSGIFSWANQIGALTLLDWLQPFQTLGQRFEPTQLLLEAAKSSGKFYEIAAAA